tara:strand:- start:453 stop:761 length:309 start_codon:yes stop_codon:yes gene_type:complete
MAYLDHLAILKAYPNACEIHDSTGAFDKNGNKIELDQSKVNAARVELNKLQYRYDRLVGVNKYASVGEQLGMLYDDIISGKVDASGKFASHNKTVKDANPKP